MRSDFCRESMVTGISTTTHGCLRFQGRAHSSRRYVASCFLGLHGAVVNGVIVCRYHLVPFLDFIIIIVTHTHTHTHTHMRAQLNQKYVAVTMLVLIPLPLSRLLLQNPERKPQQHFWQLHEHDHCEGQLLHISELWSQECWQPPEPSVPEPQLHSGGL